MSFVGVVKSFSFRIESTPTTYECPLIRGSFTLQKRRFKLQSDMYIICNVPSQYIFSTGSGNQKSPCLPPRVQASWVKNQGFSLQRRACRGRLVERTRPRPAPRSEWNFPRVCGEWWRCCVDQKRCVRNFRGHGNLGCCFFGWWLL